MKKAIIPKKMRIFLILLTLLTIIFYGTGFTILKLNNYNFKNYINEIDFSNLNLHFSDNSIGSHSEKNFPIDENITTLNLMFKNEDININSYDGNDLKVEVKNSNSISQKLNYTVVNDEATLKTHNMSSKSTINISIPKSFLEKGDLSVGTISGDIFIKDIKSNSITISATSGDIEISNLNANFIKTSNISGDIEADNVNILKESNLSTTSGTIKCSGYLGETIASSTSGDIDINVSNSIKKTSLNSSSGSISLLIPKSSSYKIDHYTVSGDFNCSHLENGNDPVSITLKTISGDIDVESY